MEKISQKSLSLMANALRALSIDMVDAAQSGHPGAPLGMADIVAVLYKHFLKFNPECPELEHRDRFILSNGHASALLYSALYLSGYDLSLGDLKNFRQLRSCTAGHPEYGHVSGVEVTTGPLGQGIAMAVGIALACKRKGLKNKVYCMLGDGCLMEGISHEAFELAASLNLNNLVFMFDNNDITIDGKASMVCHTNHLLRMQSYGFKTFEADGHSYEEIYDVFKHSQMVTKPVFISFKTSIGKYSSVVDSSKAHGAPLDKVDLQQTKDAMGWHSEPFDIPEHVMKLWRDCENRSFDQDELLDNGITYKKAIMALEELIKTYTLKPKDMPTRKAGGLCLEAITPHLPHLVSGSADLAGSVNTKAEVMRHLNRDDYSGNFIYYGVREHGMGAVMNGLAREKLLPVSGTFLTFADYMKEPIRLSALMGLSSIFVLTHDSIALGEDGPTHQPIEQLCMLRSIPNMHVFRPADIIETALCWQKILERASHNLPSCLILTRQTIPALNVNKPSAQPYPILENKSASVQLLASGSEVHLALGAAMLLQEKGILAEVISVPCLEELHKNSSILRKDAVKVSIEAAESMPWYQFVDFTIGMTSFGLSGKGDEVLEHFGFTSDKIASQVLSFIS